MGFSGGGSNVLLPHTHDGTVSQDGGPLNFNNITQSQSLAGMVFFSDGTHLQQLAYPGVPAGETLTAVAASTSPSWVAGTGSGETCVVPQISAANGLRNNIPRFGVEVLTNDLSIGKTLTDVSFFLQNGGATGNGEARVYDSGGALQATSTTTKDWATLPGAPNYEKVTFDISHTVAAGDRIVIAGGSTGLGAEVTVNHSPASQVAISPNLSTYYDVDFQACVEYNSATVTWSYASSLTSCMKWCYTTS